MISPHNTVCVTIPPCKILIMAWIYSRSLLYTDPKSHHCYFGNSICENFSK